MMDKRDRAEWDQQLAQVRDHLPTVWMALYVGCMQAGFSEQQAFSLVQTWILGQNPNGSRPNTTFADNKDQ
jgi:hypothetical protein